VYLPRTTDVVDAPKSARGKEAATRHGGQEQILVVDDEASLLRLVTETLTHLGYAPIGFTAGAAALAAFLADPDRFDAVVTDESMPGVPGTELIRKIRAVRPQIPIVLVTGLANAAVIQRAKDAGATEVVRKPLSARQLATTVERVLRQARPPVAGPFFRTPRAPQLRRRGVSTRTRPARS
jgi:DNA-binding NtrC family response regulator